MGNPFQYREETTPKNPHQGLLSAGWRPLHREIDLNFVGHLLFQDSAKFQQQCLNLLSNLANTLGRNEYAWWANFINLFSQDSQCYWDDFWNYVTPAPPSPDYRYPENINVTLPVKQVVSREAIPIAYVLDRLLELIILKILDFLGTPDLITQYDWEQWFYFPIEKFTTWKRLPVLNIAYAYWSKHQVWLQIEFIERGQSTYTLFAQSLPPLIQKATYGMAIILSGYQSRVGQIQSLYSLRSFPADIQAFSDTVQQAVLDQNQLAVLVHGAPGTGKTAWTQAIAKEILMPLGYVIFILDHDAVENFVPPSYLDRIAIIINEADNLAQNRGSLAAQTNHKTEHILSLLDGTLYQSVVDEAGLQVQQKLVVLMTCNTLDRFDPAVLRKGRVDLTYHFTHCFV